MDLEIFEALLANMQHTLQPGVYDDVDDDDDEDDYDDEDDDEDDDEYEYGGGGGGHEHSIHTMANPFGGGADGGMVGGGGEGMDGVSLPTMQTMSILQGLLNMNPQQMPGGADMGAAMGSLMNAGMGDPMGGGGAGGDFLAQMPAFMQQAAGAGGAALAGAFGANMGALMDGLSGGQGGHPGAGMSMGATLQDYDEDDVPSDEDTEEEEDEEDDEDDEDSDEDEHRGGMSNAAIAAMGAAGGMMAAGLLGAAGHPGQRLPHPSMGHPGLQHPGAHPGLAGHPGMNHPGMHHPAFSAHAVLPGHPGHHGHPSMMGPPVGMVVPPPMGMVGSPMGSPMGNPMVHDRLSPPVSMNPASMNPASMTSYSRTPTSMTPSSITPASMTPASLTPASMSQGSPLPAILAPPSSAIGTVPVISSPETSSATTTVTSGMSGGTMRTANPLAGLTMGTVAGVVAGAGILAPVVNNLLVNAAKPGDKLDTSDNSNVTITNDSLNSSDKTITSPIGLEGLTRTLQHTHLGNMGPSSTGKKTDEEDSHSDDDHDDPSTVIGLPKSSRGSTPHNIDDDKSSVGSSHHGSEERSDTESVRKKTPSPVLLGKMGRMSPTGSDSSPVLESASCASITDLASATESMRDSDTDNHSDAHNVTANLSDVDSDLHEAQPKQFHPAQQFSSPTPIVIEKPTFGWNTMVGLDTAKEALKTLFIGSSFPEVYEGVSASCKGVLLFGPEASGKTCLARALAKEVNEAILIGISTGYLLSQSPLEAIKIVRYLFDHARMHRPAVILFDEIDALCYDRASESALRAKAELLAQVRGLTSISPAYPARCDPHSFNEGIMLLGTTKSPWLLDDDTRRIFTYNIHVKLPNEPAREQLFRMFLHNLPHNIVDDQFQCIVSKSEGYSAADVNTVIRQVVNMPPSEQSQYIQNRHRVITFDDLATVMTDYRCRFTPETAAKYQAYIRAATHRSEDQREDSPSKDGKRPKGVKKFGRRIAKSLAAALVAVID